MRDLLEYNLLHINYGVFKKGKLLAKKYIPYWSLNVNQFLNKEIRMSPIELLAGRWVIINKFLLNMEEDKNYNFTKFEDIFLNRKKSRLKDICDILNVNCENEIIDNGLADKINQEKLDLMLHWKKWTPKMTIQVDGICGKLMREFGYGNENIWKYL